MRLFHALAESDLEDISYNQMNNVLGVAKSALELFRNIQQFSISKYPNSPIQQRNSFIEQAKDQYDNIYTQVSPVVAFTLRKGFDFKRLEDDAKAVLKRLEAVASDSDTKLTNAVKDAQGAVEAVRKVAAEAGVSQHYVHFKNEADRYEESAKPWLLATVITAGLTLLFAIGLIARAHWVLPNLSASQSIQLAIPKLFLFSILVSATIWCGKTYRSNRHNAVVNRHRQNALATFQAFVEATGDDATKNAVLIQATQSIFAPQQTGYVQGEADVAMPQVLELIRTGVGK